MIPAASDSEKHVLSLCLQEPEKWIPRAVGDGLGSDHWHNPAHKALWEDLLARHKAGKAEEIGLAFLTQAYRETGFLEIIGGPAGLNLIYTAAATGAGWSAHVRKLIETQARRRAWEEARNLEFTATNAVSDSEELEAAARRTLEAVCSALTGRSPTLTPPESAERFRARLSDPAAIQGLRTGLFPLDGVTGGPKPGELWVICGESGGGKSVLLNQIAGAAGIDGNRVLIFTLELTAEATVARILAGSYGASFPACCNPGKATKGELRDILSALEKFLRSAILINDDENQTAARIVAETERAHDQDALGLVVVDYLQLMNGERKRNESRDEEIGRNVKSLKQMAKRFRVPVLTASQLNDDGRLFGSRATKHHSDVVLRIQPDGILVDKNRDGKAGGLLPLLLNGEGQQFYQTEPNQS